MSALQRIARPVLRAASRRQMSSIETFEKPSYDILPVPKGSWQEQYNQKNAYANKVLVVGVLAVSGVLAHSLQDDRRPVLKTDLPIDPRKC